MDGTCVCVAVVQMDHGSGRILEAQFVLVSGVRIEGETRGVHTCARVMYNCTTDMIWSTCQLHVQIQLCMGGYI